ncbi:SDR family NAD(P)-dependent oxidoreductase [Scytonema sp. UIC 10036]|uniref:SDR family oxidoreductase n=1 Tax=Scytonema sp. UIC 10036 TaxID=2304196 RepID=UPI0012DA8B03|nr:SDR family oxidoreductase [Scytonema sp. UIC 10036]MUG97273.1 SDR family NAD(P)-dependent oxidoreductase [Scytonema sp. UIC 10036]
MQNHDKKIALVTGANKGLGFEISRQLATTGLTVLIGARDENKGAEAAEKLQAQGFDVQSIKLNVSDISSIATAAKNIEERFGKLDILINNAGVLHDGGVNPSDLDVKVFKETFETNVFGAFAVLQAMLPLIRKSNAGRIVNISSTLGSLTDTLDPNSHYFQYRGLAYQASKTALNAITVQFAKELADTPIKVNSACPGWLQTDMGSADAPGTVEEGADTPVWLATLPEDGPTGGFFNSRKPVPW